MLFMMMALAAVAQSTDGAKPAERARANLGSYFSTDDYPPSAAARGAEGTVRFELEVGPEGLVSKCNVIASSGDAALDAATCSILLGRARYAPARDAEGRPVVGHDFGSVTWRLPPPLPGLPFARFATVSRLRSNGAGELSCLVTTNGVAEADAVPNYCGDLAYSGASEMLRQAPVPLEVTLVSVGGPADDAGVEAVGADEAGYGDLQYDYVSDLVIGQNGRVLECRVVSSNIPPSSLFGEPDELCELPPPGAPPLFEPATSPAPRRARMRTALYIKGWPDRKSVV